MRPLMPPASLRSWAAASSPAWNPSPAVAAFPESGWVEPILIEVSLTPWLSSSHVTPAEPPGSVGADVACRPAAPVAPAPNPTRPRVAIATIDEARPKREGFMVGPLCVGGPAGMPTVWSEIPAGVDAPPPRYERTRLDVSTSSAADSRMIRPPDTT